MEMMTTIFITFLAGALAGATTEATIGRSAQRLALCKRGSLRMINVLRKHYTDDYIYELLRNEH